MLNAISCPTDNQSPEKPKSGLKSGPKDEKRNQIKKIIKDKLNYSNINELVLCDKSFNNGMFGCLQGG